MHCIIGSRQQILKPPPALFAAIDAKFYQEKELLLRTLAARGLPRTAEEFHAFERSVQTTSCELQSGVTGAVLEALNEDECFRAAACAAFTGDRRLRSAGVRSTKVHLAGGGSVELSTPYMGRRRVERRGRRRRQGRRGAGGAGLFPVLLCLGVRWGATPALAADVARQAADSSSYDCARESLEARGIKLDVKVIRRLTMALGNKGLKVREARLEEAHQGRTSKDLTGKRIVVSVDGGRLRSRVPRKRGRRRAGTKRHGYDCPWREPKCFVIYEVDERGKKKRGTLPVYEATLGDCDALVEILVAELKLRGAAKAQVVLFIADGAEWIWERIPGIVKAVGIDPQRVRQAVDYYHAVENLQAAAEVRTGWIQRRRTRWVNKMKGLLWEGKVVQVIEAIGSLCRGRNAKALRTKRDYFEDRKRLMPYDKIRRQKLPLGSGAVESAIRRIVNLRLKGPGIFWRDENAEAMLYLRAQLKAGRWEEMVKATFALDAVAA